MYETAIDSVSHVRHFPPEVSPTAEDLSQRSPAARTDPVTGEEERAQPAACLFCRYRSSNLQTREARDA